MHGDWHRMPFLQMFIKIQKLSKLYINFQSFFFFSMVLFCICEWKWNLAKYSSSFAFVTMKFVLWSVNWQTNSEREMNIEDSKLALSFLPQQHNFASEFLFFVKISLIFLSSLKHNKINVNIPKCHNLFTIKR